VILSEQLLKLGRELSVEQDRALSQDLSLGSVRARLLGRPPRPTRARRWVALAAVAALSVGAWVYGQARYARPLDATFGGHSLAVGQWVSASDTPSPRIEFSDGSLVSLRPGSRARLSTLDSAGAHVVLESGSADVRVTPNRGAKYRMSLGPFAVDVTGTRFDVGFRPSDEVFTLSLHEGKVVVSGCVLGEGRPLLAGESVTASCRSGHFEISGLGAQRSAAGTDAAAQPKASSAPLPSTEAPVTAPHAARPAEATPAAPTWRSLSKQGRFADAYALVASAGFEAALARASVGELALLGDTARFAGKPDDALSAYQALRSRAAGTAGAKQAAFSIARVHFDQRAAYAEASRWFRTYLAEQPGGPFAREAEGRLMEALSRAGDRAGARQVAQQYLSRYPSGPHERVARQLTSR
jgi:FecR protein